ncbi:Nn.00g015220.m01.CDS01 [Neocucurbitaria sp. VM-36]
MVEFKASNLRVRPPLILQSVSDDPLNIRLAAMREAIAAGQDPNELGGMKNPGVARPLHYAIPDLRGRSPIEELEAWFRAYNECHSDWATEDLELYPFNEAALKVMKKAAAKLDAQDDGSDQQTLDKKESVSSGSIFDKVRSW